MKALAIGIQKIEPRAILEEFEEICSKKEALFLSIYYYFGM